MIIEFNGLVVINSKYNIVNTFVTMTTIKRQVWAPVSASTRGIAMIADITLRCSLRCTITELY